MHNLNSSTYKVFGGALLVLGLVGMAFMMSPLALNAKTVKNPQKKAAKSALSYSDASADPLSNIDNIEEMAYSNDKEGCATKASMFGVTAKQYRAGIRVEDIVSMKIMQPLFENIYATIHKKGVEQAMLDNMKEYQYCVANAEANPDSGSQYDMSLVNDACVKLNSVVLDTLSAIKRRKKIGSVINKYERKTIDMSGTSYANIPNPSMLFIGSLYKAAQTRKYIDVVEMGSDIISGCRS